MDVEPASETLCFHYKIAKVQGKESDHDAISSIYISGDRLF
jgi:hypothetical protein